MRPNQRLTPYPRAHPVVSSTDRLTLDVLARRRISAVSERVPAERACGEGVFAKNIRIESTCYATSQN